MVAALAGDWQAARDVQLNLPETGVCITDYQDDAPCCDPIAVDCCAPAPIALGDIPVASATPQALARLIRD